MIQFIAEDIKLPLLEKSKLKKWIQLVVSDFGLNTGEISYIFCSENKILEINNQFLKHDFYTDIITFDYSENGIISGDIFISIDTVKSNSELFNVSFGDELKRILIHGILHLCGLDDKTPDLKKVMTENENKALAKYPE